MHAAVCEARHRAVHSTAAPRHPPPSRTGRFTFAAHDGAPPTNPARPDRMSAAKLTETWTSPVMTALGSTPRPSDDLTPRYAEMVYNGFWFSPEREALQVLVDKTQEYCTGVVRLKLYKGNVMVQGRKSPYSLYDPVVASFEDDKGLYNQADAGCFIKLQALRLRTLAVNRHKML
ncbi:MAG: hypothetical protein WDW36_007073 [Sanguina aurantia]